MHRYGAYRDGVTNDGPWAHAAAVELAALGFTLINSDRPAAIDGSQLLVALRDKPTLRHFDPELVTCWVAAAGRGKPLRVDRRSLPGDQAILWGHVHVVDRLGVENRFLTFGGPLRISDVDTALRVVQLASPGPVVRWGGHSQGSDPLAGEIGAFFGRLIVPVDYLPGGEGRIAAEAPAGLYAAFLKDRVAHHGTDRGGGDPDPLLAWLRGEAARIRDHDPFAWSAGETLLRDLGLRT